MRLHGSAWLRQSYCAGRSAKVSSRSHRLRCAALLTRSPVPIGVPGQSLDKSLKQLSSLGANFDDAEVVSQNLRDVQEVSFVSRRRLDDATFDAEAVDEEGLPLIYNERRLDEFWRGKWTELAGRWTRFSGVAAPWLVKLANALLSGQLEQRQAGLARDAVANLERLGPTFIKLGQILSIRPDVLPPPVMAELAALQDNMPTFPTVEARALIEKELGKTVEEVFSEFGREPVAAASLAQVYKARLRSTGEQVAVKVQRPGALSTISKDLYVMRRAVGVYERIIRRFTAQTTDYQRLLSTFAEGLYTEMDFRNEALNSMRMEMLLHHSDSDKVNELVIPKPNLDFTTRRVLTMEWITGVKLTSLEPAEIRSLVGIGQESFLTQLLEIGYLHGDPHPGNLLKVTAGPNAGKLALLDFGLVAEVPAADREAMISATIHLANRDWNGLITDFINLKFLPLNSNRAQIVPVMDRVLSPYLRGGGATSFNFQALSQDLLKTSMQIPFSVPPYMSLLARSVATLEGIALMGDPQYQMVAQAYPWVVRRILCSNSSNSMLLLRDILYDSSGNVKPMRLSALLNAALGYVADEVDGFVDFDAVPEEGASAQDVMRFLCSPSAGDLRRLLVRELVNGLDLLLRDRLRRAFNSLPSMLAPRVPLFGPLPMPPAGPLLGLLPVFVPGLGFKSAQDVLALVAPTLDQGEEVHLQSLIELVTGLAGMRPADLEVLNVTKLLQLAVQPSAQIQELQQALSSLTGSPAQSQVVQQIATQVVNELAVRQTARVGVPVDTLFPVLPLLQSASGQPSSRPYGKVSS